MLEVWKRNGILKGSFVVFAQPTHDPAHALHSRLRSGSSLRIGFEGGQMPLVRRIPNRGFNNSLFAVRYVAVIQNLWQSAALGQPVEHAARNEPVRRIAFFGHLREVTHT